MADGGYWCRDLAPDASTWVDVELRAHGSPLAPGRHSQTVAPELAGGVAAAAGTAPPGATTGPRGASTAMIPAASRARRLPGPGAAFGPRWRRWLCGPVTDEVVMAPPSRAN